MITALLPHEIGISVSYPLPGTPFYDKVKTQLREKSNWTDSDELALMFRNTYEPAFYKQLHRYVHKSYRKHLAIDTLKHIAGKPASLSFRKIKKALSLCYYYPSSWIARQKLKDLDTHIG
jgi:anaerobic magnesium-protoporphyrin IX monomethyl ester cyclase